MKLDIILKLLLIFLIIFLILYFLLFKVSGDSDTEIPKIIFQTWKTRKVEDIPSNMRKWSLSWKTHNPSYKYLLWDDHDNRDFIQNIYPWFLTKYDSYDKEINRADAIRYFFLYHYGGIYADMDFECLKDFDSLLEQYKNYDIILGKMGTNTHENDIPNALMISKPHQEFWLYVFVLLLEKLSDGHVEAMTGPILLKNALEIYLSDKKQEYLPKIEQLKNNFFKTTIPKNSSIKILDSNYFYPIDWTNDDDDKNIRVPILTEQNISNNFDAKKEYPNSYAVTYWAHSW